ncbi:hypothetical protein FEM48_Zijuj10G0110400 [Ziziphus jujuba var. spinosa]|uniref:Uncharacterized protein n=1 Tax=Ziziphus jujuba var. spinosa TaxID=714518 RepID=A0A978UN01_ZIZJJ|nr:hypothetical protein FEM48_Zijuj10G0110400 [Ziziphus jujuba var. spinosa]
MINVMIIALRDRLSKIDWHVFVSKHVMNLLKGWFSWVIVKILILRFRSNQPPERQQQQIIRLLKASEKPRSPIKLQVKIQIVFRNKYISNN